MQRHVFAKSLGFVLALAFIIDRQPLSITRGYPWPGSLMSGVGLVPLIRLFVHRQRKQINSDHQQAVTKLSKRRQN